MYNTLFLLLLSAWVGTSRAFTIPTLPSGWSYQGCWYEGIGQRGLNDSFWGKDSQTDLLCIDHCAGMGFKYAGLEMGTQCFCGDALHNMDLAEESNCSYFCNGDDNQPCGGYAYMTLFELSSSSSSDQTSSSASSKKSTTTAAAAATTKAATTTSTSPTSSAGTTPGTSATTTSPGSSSNSASSTSSFALSYVVSNTIPSLNNYTSMPSTFVAASASNAQSDGSAAGSRVSTKSTNALPVIAATATAMGFVAAPTLRDAKQGIMFGYTLSSSSSTSFTTSSSTILSAIFFSLILPLLIPL